MKNIFRKRLENRKIDSIDVVEEAEFVVQNYIKEIDEYSDIYKNKKLRRNLFLSVGLNFILVICFVIKFVVI